VTTLVTGASGFLGGHLTRALAARGERIRVLVRPGADLSRIRSLVAEVVEGDICDERAVRSATAGCRLVFHLAGVVSHDRRDLPLMQAVNVAGTRRVLASVEPGARLVHVSSVASIGPVTSPDLRADEEHASPPPTSRLPYAATKRAGELAALEAAARGLDVVVANPGFLLGPGDVHRVSTWPVSAYVAGKLRFTTAGGLSFVDARDVADGLVALSEHGRAGERTILTAEDGNLSWDDFFSLITSVSGIPRRTVRLPAHVAALGAALAPAVTPDQVRAAAHWWFFTAAKAAQQLGFRTRPLDDTIADTIADHKA